MITDKMICPWWMGYILANPLRRLIQKPEKILSPFIKNGDRILEVGPGMGFFTLTMAGITGDEGKIYCVDLQEKMLAVLRKKAARAGLDNIIETRICTKNSLLIDDLHESIDFALLFAVVHEIPDQESLFRQIYFSMKHGGKMLVSEPSGHVSGKNFSRTVSIAENTGFSSVESPSIKKGHSALFVR